MGLKLHRLFWAVVLSVVCGPVQAADFRIALPTPVERSQELGFFGRDVVIYTLSYFLLPPSQGLTIADDFVVSESAVTPHAQPYFQQMQGLRDGSEVLEYVLRTVLRSSLYNDGRIVRQHPWSMPSTSHALAHTLGLLRSGDATKIRDWTVDDARCLRTLRNPSRVKKLSRYIWRCTFGAQQKISLAFTLDTEHFTPSDLAQNPRIREAEIIVAHGTSEPTFDFYVYGHDGHLALSSTFASGDQWNEAPTPHACLACHYDAEKRRFGRTPTAWRSNTGL